MFIDIFIPIVNKEIQIPLEEKSIEFKKNDLVLIEREDKEQDYGKIVSISNQVKPVQEEKKWKIIRKCQQADLVQININLKTAKSYKESVIESIKSLELNIALVKVELSFNQKLVLVVFTSETRIDFRQLVRVLAGKFKKKIQMLQIGARDRAQLVEGCGMCGRKLCCQKHLKEIPSVIMDAAREQNIAFKGAENLSGVCEKLKCCLNFEVEEYKKLKKLFPKFGTEITIDKQKFVVAGLDILNKKVKLRSDHIYKVFDLDEFNKLKK